MISPSVAFVSLGVIRPLTSAKSNDCTIFLISQISCWQTHVYCQVGETKKAGINDRNVKTGRASFSCSFRKKQQRGGILAEEVGHKTHKQKKGGFFKCMHWHTQTQFYTHIYPGSEVNNGRMRSTMFYCKQTYILMQKNKESRLRIRF